MVWRVALDSCNNRGTEASFLLGSMAASKRCSSKEKVSADGNRDLRDRHTQEDSSTGSCSEAVDMAEQHYIIHMLADKGRSID